MSEQHREYFNRLAHQWENLAAGDARLEDFVHRIGVKNGERVLDVGAGTGRISKILAARAGCIVDVDISEKMLKSARALLPNEPVLYLCADVCYLALPPDYFDKIICFSTFPHIQKPSQGIQEMYRVLKPGGKLLIFHDKCSRQINALHASLEKPVSHDYLPTAEALNRDLCKIGFLQEMVMENPEIYWVQVRKPV